MSAKNKYCKLSQTNPIETHYKSERHQANIKDGIQQPEPRWGFPVGLQLGDLRGFQAGTCFATCVQQPGGGAIFAGPINITLIKASSQTLTLC